MWKEEHEVWELHDWLFTQKLRQHEKVCFRTPTGQRSWVEAQPYCAEFGLVKSLSSDKPRKIGFYISIVAPLGELLNISQAQMRLVSVALQDADLDDSYGMDRYQQEVLFTQIVRKHAPVSEQIRELL